MSVRRKKICIVMPVHWKAFMGGAQYQVKLLLDELLRRDVADIYYLTRRVADDYSPADYRIIKISENSGWRRYGYFFDYFRVARILRKIRPDVIYQRIGCAYTGMVGLYGQRRDCHTIWHVAADYEVERGHFGLQLKNIPRIVDKKMLELGVRTVKTVVTQTRHQSDVMHKHYGRAADLVIPNFHPFPQTQSNKAERVAVVWIANIKGVKRPELFVDLAQALVGEACQFYMIGYRGDEKYFGQLHQTIAATPNLTYLGQLSQDEVNQFLDGAHLLVNTSRYEGFSNTFIQAWMRKVPVLTLGIDPDGLIKSEGLGAVAQDYAQLVENVRLFVRDQRLRAECGEAAMNYALRNHSLQNAGVLADLLLR